MKLELISSTYNKYSRLYDFLFHIFFSGGRKDAINSMNLQKGENVLEVGVGTGASLPLYPRHAKIMGIDLSPKMLQVCEKRIQKKKLQNAEVMLMNAEELVFSDGSFSSISAMYIVSVSPNPKKLMNELSRVCKPGGEIVIVNHFSYPSTWISKLEKKLSVLSAKIGFRPYFPLDRFIKKLPVGLEIVEIKRTGLFNYWTLIRLKNNQP